MAIIGQAKQGFGSRLVHGRVPSVRGQERRQVDDVDVIREVERRERLAAAEARRSEALIALVHARGSTIY